MFLKQKKTGTIYISTPELRQRDDMEPCDKDGNILAVEEGGEAPKAKTVKSAKKAEENF